MPRYRASAPGTPFLSTASPAQPSLSDRKGRPCRVTHHDALAYPAARGRARTELYGEMRHCPSCVRVVRQDVPGFDVGPALSVVDPSPACSDSAVAIRRRSAVPTFELSMPSTWWAMSVTRTRSHVARYAAIVSSPESAKVVLRRTICAKGGVAPRCRSRLVAYSVGLLRGGFTGSTL